MSYDPMNKMVRQNNSRIIYANGFGGISTIEPDNNKQSKLDEARIQINQMDKAAHGWK